MDFKFGDYGHRLPPLPPPQPPLFSEHAFRGGYPIGDQRPSPEISRVAGDYYDPIQREIEKEPPLFSEHALRGGYPIGDQRPSPEILRVAGDYYDPIQREIEKEPPLFSEHALRGGYPIGDQRPSPEISRVAGDYYNPIQREIEKERIRKEIIAEDMARRMVFEAEVRRVTMVEREIAMRACVSYEDRWTMQLDRRVDFVNGGRHGPLIDAGFGFGGRGVGFDRALPLPSRELVPRVCEVTGAAEGGGPSDSNKKKLIMLPKPVPKPNLSGEKRKAETSTPTDVNDLSSILKKKPREEWSCALCQVNATSEQGLNDHLNGKKHKAKEARLRDQKKTTLFTNSRNTSALIGKPNGSLEAVEISSDDNNMQLNLTDQDGTNAMAREDQHYKTARPHKKDKGFKFWCGICEVGAYSTHVMESHTKGKNHISRLDKVRKGKAVVSAEAQTTGSLTSIENTTVPPEEATTAHLMLAEEDVKTRSIVAAE